MTADEEDEILRIAGGAFDDLDESGRIEGASGGIEKDFARARVFGEQIEAARLNFAHLTSGKTRGALYELSSDGVGMGVARFADVIDEQGHAFNMSDGQE